MIDCHAMYSYFGKGAWKWNAPWRPGKMLGETLGNLMDI